MGRALPSDVQRDTGAIDPDDTYERRAEVARTRKRARDEGHPAHESELGSATPKTSSVDGSHRGTKPQSGAPVSASAVAGAGIATVLDARLAEANLMERRKNDEASFFRTLEFVLKYGSPEDQAIARSEMLKRLQAQSSMTPPAPVFIAPAQAASANKTNTSRQPTTTPQQISASSSSSSSLSTSSLFLLSSVASSHHQDMTIYKLLST